MCDSCRKLATGAEWVVKKRKICNNISKCFMVVKWKKYKKQLRTNGTAGKGRK